MLIFWAVLGGFLLDALFGDPAWLPHPVVLMGRCISALEKHLRTALPKTPRGELAGGAAVAAVLPLGTLAVTGLACWAAARLHPALGLALQMLWCGQALAAKGLAQESRNVYKELAKGDLPAARRAVARIVGRDTQNLTAAGVTRAAVETVAENASDGVIAPLLYMLLGGAPLALTYKAINTMDSMLGYKNEKYLYFGRCAAKLDDAANWLPSRLAALLWVAAAALTGNSARGAWRIWRRDRRRHASPNSAQTESACAGALGVQLTISRPVQRAVEAVAHTTMQSGSILVLDTATAAVRASVSVPGYDPEHLADSLQAENSPFLNRTLQSYAVGSVFKPVLAAAALEAGLQPVFECTGAVVVDGQVFRCAGGVPHGQVDLAAALEKAATAILSVWDSSWARKNCWTPPRLSVLGRACRWQKGLPPRPGSCLPRRSWRKAGSWPISALGRAVCWRRPCR